MLRTVVRWRRFRSWVLWVVLATMLNAQMAAAASASLLCTQAVHNAELRYGLPAGLLLAISRVESGREDAVTHRLEPWPWTVQAEHASYYFTSGQQAADWVRLAQSRGLASIDTGCLQVNLFFHPQAFRTVEEAFDPHSNAAYAARFLVALHASAGNWQTAAGLYHSQTLALAAPYRLRVLQAMNGQQPSDVAPSPAPPTPLMMLRTAWNSTIQMPSDVGDAPQ